MKVKLKYSHQELLFREIEVLREELNRQKNIADPEALTISQKLDRLIIVATKITD